MEAKSAQGELIYNELRDYVSLQEERLRVSLSEMSPMVCGGLTTQQTQVRETEKQIQFFKVNGASDTSYLTHREIAKLEEERDRSIFRRNQLRETLEQIAIKLDITVHLQGLSEANNAAPGSTIDFGEAEALCQLIERKDKDMLLKMMRSRDEAKKDWLRNFLNGELQQMMASDRYDLQSHIKSQSADLEKLSKVVGLLVQNNQHMGQRQAGAEEELNRLEEEAQTIMEERQVYDEAFSKFGGET